MRLVETDLIFTQPSQVAKQIELVHAGRASAAE